MLTEGFEHFEYRERYADLILVISHHGDVLYWLILRDNGYESHVVSSSPWMSSVLVNDALNIGRAALFEYFRKTVHFDDDEMALRVKKHNRADGLC